MKHVTAITSTAHDPRWAYRVLAALAFLVTMSVSPAPRAAALPVVDWAWPGMQYDIYKNNQWYEGCSVGFPAWDNDGNHYIISAGHCFRADDGTQYLNPGGYGLNIYAPSNHNEAVGWETIYTNPSNGMYVDVALIEMYADSKLDGTGWPNIPDNPVDAAVGDSACLAGNRHDSAICGTVTAVGANEQMIGYPWTEAVTFASYCGLPGDSGGAVYNAKGALGIHISADDEQNGTGENCSSQFIPLSLVLYELRLTVPSLTI
ncbi:S1 family peptidase [Smaragdicoccus niigatensis]|uniref:S1 family peptidase n=1 Tax=Smaragdicoccus niigatensis TaxID=359359 RepID=UPI0012DCDD9F|nr:S1 family peptidase [Smaragdicoccus niigatensis]